MTEHEVWSAIKLAAELVTSVCAIISAREWMRSAAARDSVASTRPILDADGYAPAMITAYDDLDRFASLDGQSRLSAQLLPPCSPLQRTPPDHRRQGPPGARKWNY